MYRVLYDQTVTSEYVSCVCVCVNRIDYGPFVLVRPRRGAAASARGGGGGALCKVHIHMRRVIHSVNYFHSLLFNYLKPCAFQAHGSNELNLHRRNTRVFALDVRRLLNLSNMRVSLPVVNGFIKKIKIKKHRRR